MQETQKKLKTFALSIKIINKKQKEGDQFKHIFMGRSYGVIYIRKVCNTQTRT